MFPVENKEKGKGVGRKGGGVGDRQRNRQVNAQALSKLPFRANYPLVFPQECVRSENSAQCGSFCPDAHADMRSHADIHV